MQESVVNNVDKTFLTDSHVFMLMATIGLTLYFRALFFGFTYLDDNVLILDNLSFLQNIGNVGRAFTQEVFHILHSSASYYRPILTLSFMLDAVFSGASPFLYHLSNIIYHIIASWLVFKLFKRLKYSADLSLFFSLLFLVHPVLTQAVAWIPGRNDSLLAIFTLACFVFYLQYLESSLAKQALWGAGFFALALFTKETALVIPIVWLVYVFLVKTFWSLRVLGVLGLGWVLIGVIWFGLRRIALGGTPLPMTFDSTFSSVFFNLPALVQLLGKVFFPFNLSVLPIVQDTTFWWGVVAVLFLGAVGVVRGVRESWRWTIFGLVWFLAFLLPSFVRPSPNIVADFIEHRLYVPIIGLFFVLAESRVLRGFTWSRPVCKLGSLGVLVVLGVITFVHQGNFADRLAFWLNAATNSPHSPLAQRNLGAMYYLDGRLDKAEDYYRRSLALNPAEQMVHNNLGLIYAARGQVALAEAEYKAELNINPNYDNAHFNLGLLYYRLGRIEEAKKLWQETLKINPDYTDATKALQAISEQ